MDYREKRCEQRKTEDLKVGESIETMDVKIFPITPEQKNQTRKQKKKESEEKRNKANTRRALEQHIRKVNCNFDQSDFVIHVTFNAERRPVTKKEINAEFKKYIDRINYKRKKLGLKIAKYMGVIEGGEGTDKEIHFHIIMDGDLKRETLEDLWGKRGFVNVDRLQPNEEGLTGLTKYMSKGNFEEEKKKGRKSKEEKEAAEKEKQENDKEEEKENRAKGEKRWRTSKGNLKEPTFKINDCKFNKNKAREMFINAPSREELERLYPGYTLTDYKATKCKDYDLYYITILLRRYVKNEKIETVNKDGIIKRTYKPKKRKYKKKKKSKD